MAKIKSRKKLVAIVTAALLVAGGSTAAFAYWSSTGTGSDTATTGTSVVFEVTKTTTTGAALTPGGAAQTHNFSVKNPGTGAQNLSSVVVTVDPTWSVAPAVVGDPSCAADDYTVSASTITLGQIAAGATVTGSVTVSMNNLSENQDACKGAVVPLIITAS